MKKLLLFSIVLIVSLLVACTPEDVDCGAGTIYEDGQCIAAETSCDMGYTLESGRCIEDDVLTCDTGYVEENGECVVESLTCETGYTLKNDECIEEEQVCNDGYHIEDDQCVIDVLEVPDWFSGWYLLTEPSGDLSLHDYTFDETGFSVHLSPGARTGIQKKNVVFEPGFSYEVTFDYEADITGMSIFVQLQGHAGNDFTYPDVVVSEQSNTFSAVLPFPPTAWETNDGWLTIEVLPSSVSGTIRITNIEITKEALPTCGEFEVLKGMVCVADNNGFRPNGTPTAWFDGWEILTVPPGDKEIEDLEFSMDGYTVYLADGERSGIQYMSYVFESGYTYELVFNYTAEEAGRMLWVQMEALGGYGFTNTETWTINGTETFRQTLVIPSSYTPTEPGWIKIEVTPGAQDNVTIENIEIIKTQN